LRVIFIPTLWNLPLMKSLEPGPWRGFFFDPRTGREIPIPEVTADASGTWQPPFPPVVADWVLVLERRKG
jgi:hypothetical protein